MRGHGIRLAHNDEPFLISVPKVAYIVASGGHKGTEAWYAATKYMGATLKIITKRKPLRLL